MAKQRTRSAMAALMLLLSTLPASAAPDLYIRDTPADTGVEPNPDTGPMWISDDIWVRNYPDPNYLPYPFPTASPPWTPLPHQDPEWRDPKYGNPNYVYVRITNRGTNVSTGVEWLKLYWAKASSGLTWDTQWVDYMANNCGPTKLYGMEITKERKNAATATAAERNLYRDAILAAATSFFPGDPTSFWHKQNIIHNNTPTVAPAFAIHASLVFNSWHREFINRYEILLQEAKPTVKLLYWDWTTDPQPGAGFNFFTNTFMGASGRGTGGVSIGAPFLPALAPPPVTRQLGAAGTQPASPDASVIASTPYPNFRTTLENAPNHNASHGFIGGSGTMSFTNTAASDPFFFLLHGNVDRLWAMWQRNPAALSRLEPALTYAPQSANALINANMSPWNGAIGIYPYTVGGGYIFNKNSKHPSVVFPPIYDTARLKVPALAPGESVILEIPWYPPNPADYSCFSDAGHVCLLARVVNSDTYPHGMTFGEGTAIGTNTKNNNNIAWKNVTVVDNFPGSALRASILVRNVFATTVPTRIKLAAVAEENGTTFFDFGKVTLELHPELYERWAAGGFKGEGVETVEGDHGERLIRVDKEATLDNIELPKDGAYYVNVRFDLDKKYPAPKGLRPRWDLMQVGTPEDADEVVGGERFVLDFNQLTLSPPGAEWAYTTGDPGKDWQFPGYDDKGWKKGKAELGHGDGPVTDVGGGEGGTLYARRSFAVADPAIYNELELRLKADDGAVVYLNGKEVHRKNLPEGTVDYPTPATADVVGAEEETFVVTKIPADTLEAGDNLIAVEVHQGKDPEIDRTFDLELAANAGDVPATPTVGFAAALSGAQFQTGEPVQIDLDAYGTRGRQLDLEVQVDGKPLVKSKGAPFSYVWKGAKPGPHRLKAIAIDRGGEMSETFVTINVLDNLPPVVRISQPGDLALLPEAPSYTFGAEASDPAGGEIDRVEFYIKDGMTFGGPTQLIGIAKDPPYTVQSGEIPAGHWMIMAVAYDTKGQNTDAAPIHIEVGRAHSGH